MTNTIILKKLLKSAILAPSGHNSQPWKFELNSQSVKFFPDFSRVRIGVDPDNRELYLSLGAAVANFEVAAESQGLVFQKKYFLKSTLPFVELILTAKKVLPQNEKLAKVITARHTNRFAFKPTKFSPAVIKSFTKFSTSNSILTPVSNKSKELLSNLIYDSELIWFKSRVLVEELETWLRDDLSSSKDGLPTGVLNLYKLAVNLKMYLKKDSPELLVKAELSRDLASKASILYIVSSPKDEIESWIKVGEDYERFLLALTAAGWSHGYFNAVVELNTVRKKLAKNFNLKSYPQMLLRIGHSTVTPPRSPRRPLSSFILPRKNIK
jgi:hypothetical protein